MDIQIINTTKNKKECRGLKMDPSKRRLTSCGNLYLYDQLLRVKTGVNKHKVNIRTYDKKDTYLMFEQSIQKIL